uniref:NSFL1 cofactor p47-like n=1 Tax=Saccoglossus kowalevskii TaxID=10224 RepID=A0ABM0MPS5_SACKO|nr:PREDICTED: NSFL1 cofactor p47-like [Saccoglossus kowalevskii]
MVTEFTNITGSDLERAQFFLESSGWQLQVAIASFYDEAEMDDTPDTLPSGVGGRVSEPEGVAPPPYSATGGSRFATLSDMMPVGDEDDSSEDEGETFYAGGAERGGSGQQIVGPAKKKKASKIVEEMFQSAKEHGAQEVSAATPVPSGSSAGASFGGAGYRLGDTEGGDVRPVPGTSRSKQDQPKDMHVVLKLWKNGFTVNDTELRAFSDPKNAEFLNSVTKGEIPKELHNKAKGGEVNLDMEDHRDEEYVPAKQALKPFTGEGFKLGNPTPKVVTQSTPSVPANVLNTNPIEVDKNKPITQLQLRLADGSRLSGQFNNTHTVGDIRRFIIYSRPQYSSTVFVLQTTFPNRELTDDSKTLIEADVWNSLIVQRLK